MRTKVKGNEGSGGTVSQGNCYLVDVDAAYSRGNLGIHGEFIRAHLNGLTTALDSADAPALLGDTTWYAWYA